MNTNEGSIVKQSGNDVEGCRSEKVLIQPNMRVFLQYKESKLDGADLSRSRCRWILKKTSELVQIIKDHNFRKKYISRHTKII